MALGPGRRIHARSSAVELELQPSDTPPAFAANEADAYLHYIIDAHREAPPATLRSIEVARPAVLALASPAFIANTPPFPPRPTCWTARCCMKRATTNGGAGSISMASAMSGNSGSEVLAGASDAGRGAARAGIALANALLASEDLASGRLAPVASFPDVFWAGNFTARRDNWRATAIAAFRRWLKRRSPSALVKCSR
jgi:hypothetical protein